MKAFNIKQKLVALLTAAAVACGVWIKKAEPELLPVAARVAGMYMSKTLRSCDYKWENVKEYFWGDQIGSTDNTGN